MESPPELVDAWDHPDPFVLRVRVQPEHIDELGHTKNVHYLSWLDECAWRHSAAAGFDPEQMVSTGYAMAVRETQMMYLAATFLGDELYVGDWITANDGRLRATRSFQVLRLADKACVMRAKIDYVCIKVASGRPSRMPPAFVESYPALEPTGPVRAAPAHP
jgi:acyl-CoA thioester hydrolase